jgi:hypothetical protein
LGILELELTLGTVTAKEVYIAEYERRYKTQPVFINEQADQTVIKDLIKKVGLDRLTDAIKIYLRMNDDWFVNKNHSLRCLQDNFGKVNAKLANAPARTSNELRVSSYYLCDKCKKTFAINWDGKNIFLPPYYCPKCA